MSAARAAGAGTRVVSPMLLRLAGERATGALLRDHGTLYLVDGRIVHAESPVAPGPDILLTGGGRRPRARLGDGELEICLLGALYDAAFFALHPGSRPARFRYGAVPRTTPVRPVSALDVQRETLRRRELLDSVWPYPAVDTAPVVPRPAAPGQTAGLRQRALLEAADGVRTPAGLAWALGRPAFHTLLDVRRLAAAGLVGTPPEPGPPAPAPYPLTVREPAGEPVRETRPALSAWVGDIASDPDTALLRRLRDALEAHL
ncbi:transcriptional regulator [Streptomyces sp. LP05-1]|uniref:Transcriptional regulator n=1 Tax=Streptomyces pyxinae TaxID=2970734 RepID=A0ABT2CKE1_9ACTN|nr:transcriptional regulator [Streptomyces sp. LP05-1]MCS0637888.1 transcriptional regulator [Streptomyces sp. LP05-1]